MTRIGFFEIKSWEKAYLKSKLKNHSLHFFSDQCNARQAKDLDIVSVFIYSKVNEESLANSKVKMIATRSTGFDHININYCRKKKILVTNVPTYGENTVAEHTFALILSLSRNIHKSYVRTLKGDFGGITGFDLKEKTIGIVGGGRIGMHVARTARALGMHVRVFDVKRDTFLSEVVNFKYVEMDELLKTSDIITLHVPYNKYTHHLINDKSIAKMKKGAILINTSRGGVIDTNALLRALKKKKIAGAGLDVIEGEEVMHDEQRNQAEWKKLAAHEIFKMDNIVYTPHNAFNSKEALIRILDTTIENITSFLEKNPKNIVNK